MNGRLSDRLRNAVIDMDSEMATSTAQEIVSSGGDLADAVLNGLYAGMRSVAERYDRRELFLPQVLASANAFYEAFDVLRPHLAIGGAPVKSKMVIGVGEGDIHDIGKNLVKVMVEANGISCVDLGRDVPNEVFLARIDEVRPDYIGISTLMTPTLLSVREVVLSLTERGLREGRKVLLGGGPVTDQFTQEIGADFHGEGVRDTIVWLRVQEGRDGSS